jgi:hypothetical protein
VASAADRTNSCGKNLACEVPASNRNLSESYLAERQPPGENLDEDRFHHDLLRFWELRFSFVILRVMSAQPLSVAPSG